ncbi:MAG: PAS domain-containing protein [Bdellovibrionales bacterium]
MAVLAVVARNQIFERILKSVWVILGVYCCAYWYYGAYATFVVVLSGVLVLSPVTLTLQKSGQTEWAKRLFLLSCNFYILASDTFLTSSVHVEYYFLPALVIPLLIYDPSERLEIINGIGVTFVSWVLSLFSFSTHFPDGWVNANLPMQLLSRLNFIGAFVITLIFLRFFVRSVIDLRDQYLAEVTAKSNELNKFFDIALEKLCIAESNGYFKKLNRAWLDLGYEESELLGRPFLDFVHPDDRASTLAEVEKLKEGQLTVGFENRYRTKDGSYRVLVWTAAPDPLTGLLYSAARDITEQKETQRLLEEAQRMGRIGSWEWDPRSGEVRWSEQMFKIFGLDPKQGSPTFESHRRAIHPEDVSLWENSAQKCMTDGLSYQIRFRAHRQSDGRTIWIDAFAEARRNSAGDIYELGGTCQDITELMEAENRARIERAKALQNAKLASLGEMSAGVAHEINNPLSIIAGNLYLMRAGIEPDQQAQKLEKIERSVLRIKTIVAGLRKFSRSSESSERTSCSPSELIQEAVLLTRSRALRDQVQVETRLESRSKILCNEIEIEQVLVNLINNAIDAVRNRAERWVRVSTRDEGPSVLIEVEDSGVRPPPEVVERIFEPFFTTKPVGQGTGLGLSIAKGILEDHGAELELSEGKNTCFVLRFEMDKTTEGVDATSSLDCR